MGFLGPADSVGAADAYEVKPGKEVARVARRLKNHVSDEEIIEKLYLTALSRFPTSPELEELTQMI